MFTDTVQTMTFINSQADRNMPFTCCGFFCLHCKNRNWLKKNNEPNLPNLSWYAGGSLVEWKPGLNQ